MPAQNNSVSLNKIAIYICSKTMEVNGSTSGYYDYSPCMLTL